MSEPPRQNIEVGSIWRTRSGDRFSQAVTGPAYVIVKVEVNAVHADVLAPWQSGIVATISEWLERLLPDPFTGEETLGVCERAVESARAELAEAERVLMLARDLLHAGAGQQQREVERDA
jgi:hypothetical protein